MQIGSPGTNLVAEFGPPDHFGPPSYPHTIASVAEIQ